MSKARQNNPSVDVARFALRAGDAGVGRARAERAPTLDFVASYGSNYSSSTNTTPNEYASKSVDWQVGIQYSMPLYTGGLRILRVKQAVANYYISAA